MLDATHPVVGCNPRVLDATHPCWMQPTQESTVLIYFHAWKYQRLRFLNFHQPAPFFLNRTTQWNWMAQGVVLPCLAGLQCMWSHGFQMATWCSLGMVGIWRVGKPDQRIPPPKKKTNALAQPMGRDAIHPQSAIVTVNGTSSCQKNRAPKAPQNGTIFRVPSINLGVFGGQ